MPVTLSAARTTSLFNDQDSDGRVDLGDTLFIRLEVSNTGDTDAQNAVINDALTGQTLVAGSINISPLAVNDVFNAVGNTQFLVGGAVGTFSGPSASFAGNLLSNDSNLAGDNFPGFTLTSIGNFATSGAGSVTINADGSFSYNPAAGFSGADTFTYTLRDAGQDGIAGNSDDLTSTATVTINITIPNTVWYVDQAYDGSNGASNGTSWRPFTSMAQVNGAGGAGDLDVADQTIYVRGNHTVDVVLESGQSLIGNGAALTVGGYNIASAGAANTLTHSTGTGILLNSNNTLSGFNVVGNNAAGIGIADNGSVGTLNISSVNVTGTGKAIDIDSGGTLNVVLGTLSSSSSASEGVHLQGVSGSFTASTGAIQTSSGVGFLIGASGGGTGSSGGNANITYGGDLTSNGGASIDIQDRTGGTVTFNGAITEGAGAGIVADGNSGNINFGGQIFISSGASNAITLTNNAAAIAFTPTGTGLDITTTTGIGFRADGGGGSVTITGLANSVQTGSGRAVEIDNVTIGGAGITFQTVGMTDGGSATGIFLNNAGSGGFTITGSGTTAASGGTINSIDSGSDGNVEQGIGIYINNTNNIVLQNMAFTGDFANFGIRGTNVNNFTLRDSTANSASADNGGFGNSNAADEGVISFDNLTGTALFTGNNLSDGHEDIIVIENTTGTLNLTVNDSAANQAVIGRNGEQFGSATGNDGILVTTTGSAALTMNVTGVVFEGWRGDGIQVDARGASTANVTIANNTFHNAHLDITSAGGGAVFLGISAGTGAGPSLTYAITGNSIRGAEGSAIVASALGPSGSMSGTILNNTIGFNDGVHSAAQATTGANQGGHGIFVRAEKDGTGGTLTHAVRIENNDIGDITTGAGIFLLANGDGAAGAGTSRLEATILNNRIDELGVNAYAGINSTVGGAGGADDALMGINFQSNNINMSGATNAVAGLIFDDLASTAAFYFPGYNGPYDDAGLAAFHTGPEGNTINVAGTFASQVITSPTGTIGFNANFVLPVPLLAAAPPVDNWEAAIRAAQQQALDAWLAGQSGDGGAAGGDAGDSGGGETGGGAGAIADDGILTPAELAIFVEAAIQRWIAAGATEAQVAAMRATEIGVADLGGLYIGTSSPGIIVLDDNAAGHNWYLDTTPEADEEYSLQNGELRADPNTTAGSRVDLLTAIMHELGHQIGLEDEYGAGDANDLMFGFINPGERHLPGEEEVASADGTPVDYTALALGAVGFGTIQAGTTRQISWQTTYDGPGTNQLVPTLNNSSSVTYNNGGGDIVVNSNTNTLSTASALALDSLTLGGGIWIDDGAGGGTRGDGIRNGTEGGISGVAITLFADTNGDNVWDAGDTQLATTTSGLGGLYSFAGLAPGNYIVRVDQGNFAAVLSPYQTSSVTTPEPIDPDDNALNDDNGSRSPGDAAYSQAITLSHGDEPITDGDADPDTNLTLDFGFLAINAAPTSGSIDGDTVTFTEGQPLAALLDLGPNATIADSDSANFDGGTLTVEISGGLVAAEDRLLIRLTGTVSFNATAVFVNGTQIGTYTGANSSGPLVITFDADATPAAVAELFRAIAYNNIGGDNPTDGNRTITWTLVDGDGTASGGSDTLLITSTVNVDPVDDPGSAGADSETVAENATVDIAVLTNDSDVNGPAPVVAEVDGNPIAEGGSVLLASGALVTRNADGTLTYDPNGAFDATPRADSGASNTPSADSFTYTLAGGGTATVTMTITGVDSDDLLIDTPVNDELIGGIGDDIYSVRNNGDTLVELPGGGTDTVRTDLAAYILNAANIENLTGILNTSQVLVGNALDNRIEGGTGNDQMQGRAGNDTYVVRNSGDTLVEQVGEGTDTVETDLAIYILNAANVENLTGTVNTGQVLVGNGLDNRITGGTGNDTLQGRLGDDTYVLRNSGDTIVEQVGEGNDTIETDLAVYVLRAANVENLVGTSSGGQVLLGSAGNDRIMGDIGNDTLYGRDGDDTFVIQNSGDTIVETAGGGTDTVETALNFYFLNAANVENLTFTGVGDFYGAGNASDNVITGGAGNDILRGGLGADTLVGGAGVDRYLFDSALGGGNVDAITGFVSAFDRILLEDSIFTALAPGGLPAGAFVAGTAALDADDRIIYDSATGALFYDADGNGAGAAVQFASLGAGTVLTANDFAVI